MKSIRKMTKTLLGGGLVLLLVFALAGQAAAQDCVEPPEGLVSWWDGDSVSGTTATDIQDGNDGTMMNDATTASGKVGDAFSFDGVDDFVEIAHAANLDVGGAWSVDFWVNPKVLPPSTGNGNILVNKWVDGEEDKVVGLFSNGMVLAFLLPAGGVFSNTLLPEDTFSHVAITYDGSFMRIYINGAGPNGEPDNTSQATPLSVLNSSGKLYFGHNPHRPGTPFSGVLDEIEWLNRTLSASEIQAIFDAGSAGKCKQPNNTPVALCQNVTVSAGTDCTADASIDDGSSDPDGNPITITQDPAGPYWLGDTVVTLTVTDDSGESDSCTATVTVEDNSCPIVTAKLVPVKVKKKKGCFRVELSVADNCDDNPQVVATINGTNGAGVVHGQLVELKHKKKFKVKTKDGDSSSSDDDSSSDDCGTVRFEGPSFTLMATAIDNAGNLACEEAVDTFIFVDDDSDSSDDKSSDDKSSDDKSSDDKSSDDKKWKKWKKHYGDDDSSDDKKWKKRKKHYGDDDSSDDKKKK